MHDILTNVINRRTHRILCGAGADFKREFTLSSYEQFFKDADYTDAEYIWCPGKVPCVVAVLHKKHDFRAASVFLRV
ncbi:hypothetical protein [Hominenteromicrobium sp.]|uniref:hypothetical protein n=1 Tax=Hominenteromicrobium sp. TaxID=3073581 RepID=UPI003A9466D1